MSNALQPLIDHALLHVKWKGDILLVINLCDLAVVQ
mgnify:CR=1 FL=1